MSKSIKINAFFKTLMSIVNIVFPLITVPYVARVLSVDGYTEYNKAMSMLAWFSPFAVFGVYTYGMRTLSQIRDNKRLVSNLFTKLFSFSICTSSIVTIIFLVCIICFPSFRQYKLLYIIVSLQLLVTFFATDWANEAYESYGFILVKTFICRLLFVISVFLFVKDEDDVIIYVLLSSLSVFINNFLTFVFAKIHISFSKFNMSEFRTLIKPLFIVFLLVNSSMLYTIFDRFVLTWFGDKLQITYYNMAQTVAVAISNVTASVLLVSIPRLSNYWANNQKNEYYELLNKISKTLLAIHTPCFIGLACISFEVVYLYSGIKYIDGYYCLLLFSIRYYFSAFDMILAKQVLLATENEKVLTKIYYIGGIYNIICKIVLIIIHKLTPELCIITTLSSDILIIILQMIQVKKLNINFTIFNKTNLKYLITSMFFIPISFIVKKIILFEGLRSVVLRSVFIIIFCTVVYLIMLSITKDSLLDLIFSKIKRNKTVNENR